MIYFIRHGDTDYIKIGYSNANALARMTTLQCGNPIPLKMIGAARGTVLQEKRLHRMMAAKRVSGEWYLSDPEFDGLMQKVLDGTFEWHIPEKRGPKVRSEKKYGPMDITFASSLFHHVLRLYYGDNEYYAMMPQNAVDAWHKGKNNGRPDWKGFIKSLNERGVDWREGAPTIHEILPAKN